jgi:hypothetical protein
MKPSRLRRAVPVLVGLVILLLVLSGCPDPISSLIAGQMVDKSVPSLSITAPDDNGEYSQTVTVEGTVQDAGGEIRFLGYRVDGTLGVLLEGEVDTATIAPDGSYSFQFSTITFNGPIVVTVTAEDWNDNTVEVFITLSDPGSPISSLSAIPDNKSITLNWDAVAGASYTLYYTSDGTLPSEGYGESVVVGGTSHPLTGLTNGKLYIFLLKVEVGIIEYWSDYVVSIPLSETTLAPKVRGDYRSIYLEWAEIEGTDQFVVYRTEGDPNGTPVNLTGTIQGNSFTDTTVADDTWYYYRVQPAIGDGITSTYNGAQTFQTPIVEEKVTSINTLVTNERVRVSGNYAYVAAGADGILVVDISNPAAPSVVTTVDTTDALDLDIDSNGNYLYLADGTGGLRSFSLAVPTAPSEVDATTSVGTAVEISVVGTTHAFVLDSSGGTAVHAVDISTPSSLSWIDYYTNASYSFEDIAASSYSSNLKFIYVTTGNGDALLEIYLSVSASTIYSYRSYTDPDYWPRKVTTSGSYVYVLGQRNVDLEPPDENALLVLSKYPSPFNKLGQSSEISGYAADVRVNDNQTRAYAVDESGFHVYDVSDPANPGIVEYLNTPGNPSGVDIGGGYAFVASGVLFFQTVDLNLPNSLDLKSTYDGTGSSTAWGAAVRGQYAFVAATDPSRLQVLDVSSPGSWTELGSSSLTSPRAVDLSGNHAYVVESAGQLRIIDISDPLSPDAKGSANSISGGTNGIMVKGDYAYLTGSMGLQIFDISDPDNPFAVGLHDSDGGGMHGVDIRGSTVYTTDGAYFQPNSLKILDVSQPDNPILVAKKAGFTFAAHGVSLYGDYAFVTDNFPMGGMYAVNINPLSANFLTNYGPCDTRPAPDDGIPKGIVAYGSYAFVADSDGGLSVVDVNDPTTLSDSSLFANLVFDPNPVNTSAEDVVVSGRYAYVSDSELGLKIVELFP